MPKREDSGLVQNGQLQNNEQFDFERANQIDQADNGDAPSLFAETADDGSNPPLFEVYPFSTNFTEEELKQKTVQELKQILAENYDIQEAAYADGTKNTNNKLRQLILTEQAKVNQKEGAATGEQKTPVNAEAYKADGRERTDMLQGEPLKSFRGQDRRTVRVGIGVTINIDNYQSIRIDSAMEIPVDATQAEITEAQAAMEKAKTVVLNSVNRDIIDVTNVLKTRIEDGGFMKAAPVGGQNGRSF